MFLMNRFGIPQDRIARRLGQPREVVRDHLAKMAALPNPPNTDLSQGFTVAQVAQKHGWTEPMVWSLALEGKDDQDRSNNLAGDLEPGINGISINQIKSIVHLKNFWKNSP